MDEKFQRLHVLSSREGSLTVEEAEELLSLLEEYLDEHEDTETDRSSGGANSQRDSVDTGYLGRS